MAGAGYKRSEPGYKRGELGSSDVVYLGEQPVGTDSRRCASEGVTAARVMNVSVGGCRV